MWTKIEVKTIIQDCENRQKVMNIDISVNKLIVDTGIEILYLRQTHVSSTKDPSVTLESQNDKKTKYSSKLKSIEAKNS